MLRRRAVLSGIAVVLAVGAVAGPVGTASARSTYCSPSGDVCYGAFGKGANVKLRLSLFAGYFTRYRLCVKAPGGKTDCRRFSLHRIQHGMYQSTVAWSKHFPFRGPGTYRASWSSSSGRFRPSIAFKEGPSINVRPGSVRAGHLVRVFGLAGSCGKGAQVTLISEAFPNDHEFAGVPAVFATVDGQDSYSTLVRIPAGRSPGRYTISGRCGGGNFGVTRRLTVLAP